MSYLFLVYFVIFHLYIHYFFRHLFLYVLIYICFVFLLPLVSTPPSKESFNLTCADLLIHLTSLPAVATSNRKIIVSHFCDFVISCHLPWHSVSTSPCISVISLHCALSVYSLLSNCDIWTLICWLLSAFVSSLRPSPHQVCHLFSSTGVHPRFRHFLCLNLYIKYLSLFSR